MKECHHIVVSALLQGLGQFTQRAQGLSEHSLQEHLPWTTILLTPWKSTLMTLLGQVQVPNDFITLLTHSGPPQTPLQRLLAHAVEIVSLSTQAQEEPHCYRLRSIFTSLSQGENYFHKLEPLRFRIGLEQIRKSLFPFLNLNKESHSHYAQLYAEFQTEWSILLQDPHSTSHVHSFLPRLLNLLERYTWSVPLHGGYDISIYDHSLTSSACAQALYYYHLEQQEFPQHYDEVEQRRPKFLFIGARLSGIQDYLFMDQPMGTHNLRARSFYIQQMMETLSQKLLNGLQLLPVAKVINTGEYFLLVAPNVIRVQETLHLLQIEVEHWLYEKFFGHLTLSLAMIKASAQDIVENFLTLYDQLSHTLEAQTWQSFSQVAPHYHWQMPTWQRSPVHTDELGHKLANSMGFQYTLQSADCHFFNDQGLRLVNFPQNQQEVTYWFQDIKPNHEKLFVKEGVSCFFAYDVPKGETGEIVSFEELSQQSNKKDKGKSLSSLALLKIDVDNLMLTLNTGWNAPRLSQWVSFSRRLELFFIGVLTELLKEKFPDIYLIYATGDDALLIGPWRDIIFLSLKIHHLFEKWCCQNPKMTLSGGIIMLQASYPLYHAVRQVEAALQSSKLHRDIQGNIVKNAITLFDTTVTWHELEKLLSKQGPAERLNAYLRDEHSFITTAMIRRLLNYHMMWQKMHEEGDLRGGLWKSKLCYDVARHCSHLERGSSSLRKEGHFIVEHLMTDETMNSARIPLLYALFRNFSQKK